MRSVEQRTTMPDKEISLRKNVRLFADGVRLLNSPTTAGYTKTTRQELIKSTADLGLSLVKHPAWQLKGMDRTLDKLLGKDRDSRKDANRLLTLAANVVTEARITSADPINSIQVAKWHAKVLKAFNLSTTSEDYDLAA